ncbi:hypothetical protein FACS1894176_05820 [Bacteroidia bacterium]|nr:hypothetical protein FACS189428_2650 [Clostridia bacterium]GHV25989.1 hypothetical protein FACS1894176_05820 [Bacteroidia bacterium]
MSRLPIIGWLAIGSWDDFWHGLTLGIYKGAQKFYVSYIEGTMTSSGICSAPANTKPKTVEIGTNSQKTIGAPSY